MLPARPSVASVEFDTTPFLTIWETTRACALACRHCRAEAQREPLPGELTHDEGLALLEAVAQMGTPIMVLSGGDPLMRADLLELVRHGKQLGLRMATIPAATPRLTEEVVRGLKGAGLDQMALSLDASTAARHDRFRGVDGAFEKTMAAAGWAHEAGLPLQINTVLTASTLEDLDALIECVTRLRVVFWEVFFLVPTGRGTRLEGLTASQYERVFAKLFRLSQSAEFMVKVTEAPHYRRYYLQHRARAQAGTELPEPLRRRDGPRGSIGFAPQSVNAGKGHVFIASDGTVFPSGFLPIAAGNVRAADLALIYRTSPLFLALRDPALLKGRCGACEYRAVCGGSRARAYAVTGDYLAEEPCCAYLPARRSSGQAGVPRQRRRAAHLVQHGAGI